MSEEIQPIGEILVPMDFSECSLEALNYAKRILASSGARLHLLYVDDDPMLMDKSTDQSYRDAFEDKMSMRFIELLDPEEREKFRTVMAVRCGTAYQEIESYAGEQNTDLIVIGSVGRSAIADILLGSVASHVIRNAPCPVLSVHTK